MVTWTKYDKTHHGYGYDPYGYLPWGTGIIWSEWTKPDQQWDEETPYDVDLSDDNIYLSHQYIYLVLQDVWKTTWTKEW